MHCRRWFPSPAKYYRQQRLDLRALFSASIRCPKCGMETRCDSENFRARLVDGTPLGNHAKSR